MEHFDSNFIFIDKYFLFIYLRDYYFFESWLNKIWLFLVDFFDFLDQIEPFLYVFVWEIGRSFHDVILKFSSLFWTIFTKIWTEIWRFTWFFVLNSKLPFNSWFCHFPSLNVKKKYIFFGSFFGKIFYKKILKTFLFWKRLKS